MEDDVFTKTGIKETWYLLFGGFSDDGAGPGKYVGRTTCEKVAIEHIKKCRKDWSSTGYVDIITDMKIECIYDLRQWGVKP